MKNYCNMCGEYKELKSNCYSYDCYDNESHEGDICEDCIELLEDDNYVIVQGGLYEL